MLHVMNGARAKIRLLGDFAMFIWLVLRPHGGLAAENLFLRKQLGIARATARRSMLVDLPSQPCDGNSGL
jgi:hypothetical protein